MKQERRRTRSLALWLQNFYTVVMNFPAIARFSFYLFIAATSAIAAQAPDKVVVLKAARLFDGKSKVLVQNGVVIVQGNKIVDAGSNLPAPPDAQVIDLGDATLSPGFMDGHTGHRWAGVGNRAGAARAWRSVDWLAGNCR